MGCGSKRPGDSPAMQVMSQNTDFRFSTGSYTLGWMGMENRPRRWSSLRRPHRSATRASTGRAALQKGKATEGEPGAHVAGSGGAGGSAPESRHREEAGLRREPGAAPAAHAQFPLQSCGVHSNSQACVPGDVP